MYSLQCPYSERIILCLSVFCEDNITKCTQCYNHTIHFSFLCLQPNGLTQMCSSLMSMIKILGLYVSSRSVRQDYRWLCVCLCVFILECILELNINNMCRYSIEISVPIENSTTSRQPDNATGFYRHIRALRQNCASNSPIPYSSSTNTYDKTHCDLPIESIIQY